MGGVLVSQTYAGILPLPDHLERYEALHAGTTDRYLTMAERQSEHRQRMEGRFLNITGTTQILGVVFAGIIILAGMAAGTFLLYHDKKTEGLTAMFAPLGAIGAVFVGTRIAQQREKARKERVEHE